MDYGLKKRLIIEYDVINEELHYETPDGDFTFLEIMGLLGAMQLAMAHEFSKEQRENGDD